MISEMKLQLNTEGIKNAVLETYLPVEGVSLNEMLERKISQDVDRRLSNEYADAIANPTAGTQTQNYLNTSKLSNVDKAPLVLEICNGGKSGSEVITLEEYLNIASCKDQGRIQRMISATKAYEEQRRNSITPDQMSNYIRNKLITAIRGDYHSYLWRGY